MISRLTRAIDQMNRLIGQGVSFLIWAGIAVLCYEVVARYVFGQPTVWAHGYTQRIFGSYFILIGAYTLIQRDHVRVDILLTPGPSRRNAVLDLLNYAFLILWGLVLTIEGWRFFLDAWRWAEVDDSALRHAMWPPKLALFLGSLMITLQGINEAIKSVLYLISPTDAEATSTVGAAQEIITNDA
ncbi:TRAP transporter small permease subunit [Paracoccus sp. M683]|uniref:TRAP transporter small permease subunit n=1 Tax=Paracoccus sp. M683 TaxID=2594268 RepID=UPI001180E464|nr:TRAP transporter small permease subunit [Paracoccus sp. M683]TRW92237.1 TRAP transporter small permease subunit [Paracoccus sp. M683]